jgi:hypothetical protein
MLWNYFSYVYTFSLILSFIKQSFLIFVISIVLNEIIILSDNLKILWNETLASLDV